MRNAISHQSFYLVYVLCFSCIEGLQKKETHIKSLGLRLNAVVFSDVYYGTQKIMLMEL